MVVNGIEVPITVSTVPTDLVVNENRFGVSLSHAKHFIEAFKNQRVKGYKVCQKYHMSGKSASIHAETFLWNVINAKVRYILFIILFLNGNFTFLCKLIGINLSRKLA